MRKRLGFIVSILPFVAFSQGRMIVSVDAGVCNNAPTSTTYYSKMDGHYSSSEWQGATRATTSYFLKAGFEKQIALCEKTSISFPVAVSYRNQRDALSRSGYSYGDFSMYSGNEDYMSQSHMVFASGGVKFSMALCHKLSIYTALNVSIGGTVYQKTRQVESQNDIEIASGHPYSNTYSSYAGTYAQPVLNASGGGGILYKVSEKVSVGLSSEVYFYGLDLRRRAENVNRMFNFGYNNRAAIVNTGLRVQYHF